VHVKRSAIRAFRWLWMKGAIPVPIRIALLVFASAWVALLLHELAHALMARALGIRVWGITLGRGPLLWEGTIRGCRIRIALLPLHGEVRLCDEDAEELGYRFTGAPHPTFEWLRGSSWRAPLITAAGSVANLIGAKLVLAYWALMPNMLPPLFLLSFCLIVVNSLMFLNLAPIRGLDGWRMAMQAAAWRQAQVVER